MSGDLEKRGRASSAYNSILVHTLVFSLRVALYASFLSFPTRTYTAARESMFASRRISVKNSVTLPPLRVCDWLLKNRKVYFVLRDLFKSLSSCPHVKEFYFFV